MTVKEAILKSLEELKIPSTFKEIYYHISTNKYWESPDGETPDMTVQSRCGDFIRNGDSRVKRMKGEGRSWRYYLSKFEDNFDIESVSSSTPAKTLKANLAHTNKAYNERDLHKLLSTYLKTQSIFSKTIFHEQSQNTKDSNQKWTHPDMIGVQFLNLKRKASQNLSKAINKVSTLTITSYEIKKEIISDSELKRCFFQAVSNSSWANYGYLVAFEISDSLHEEIERLSEAFGIGVIELRANAFESKVLFQSKYRSLDFRTIDKLCSYSSDFDLFIDQVEKMMTANDKYLKATENELSGMCDEYFSDDSQVESYCSAKNIPLEL